MDYTRTLTAEEEVALQDYADRHLIRESEDISPTQHLDNLFSHWLGARVSEYRQAVASEVASEGARTAGPERETLDRMAVRVREERQLKAEEARRKLEEHKAVSPVDRPVRGGRG